METPHHKYVKNNPKDLSEILKHLPNLTGKILDFGCGDGFVAYWLSKVYPSSEVTGYDYNGDLIKNIHHNPNCYFLRQEYNLHFGHGDFFNDFENVWDVNFQAVFMMNNLYHSLTKKRLDDKSLGKVLNIVSSFTEKDGFYIVSAGKDFLIMQKQEDCQFKEHKSNYSNNEAKKRFERLLSIPVDPNYNKESRGRARRMLNEIFPEQNFDAVFNPKR